MCHLDDWLADLDTVHSAYMFSVVISFLSFSTRLPIIQSVFIL